MLAAFSIISVTHAESGPSVKANGFFGIDVGREKSEDRRVEVRGEARISDDRSDDRKSEKSEKSPTERANREITRRIESLTKLKTRIDAMKRLTDSQKTSLKSSIDVQITALNDLKAKIAATTDVATIKTYLESITKNYRTYMLVMPQIQVIASADRILTTIDLFTTFGTKLDTRIAEAKTAGKDVASLEAASVDMKAQLLAAKTSAQASIDLVVNLKPDNGDTAVAEANKKALADARAKLKTAREAIQKAHTDARTIVKGLKGFDIKVDAKLKPEKKNDRNDD